MQLLVNSIPEVFAKEARMHVQVLAQLNYVKHAASSTGPVLWV